MFKRIFSITETPKNRRTWFHKKYRMFDGIGSFHFDTEAELNSFLLSRNRQLKLAYTSLLSIHGRLTDNYINKVYSYSSNSQKALFFAQKMQEVYEVLNYLLKPIYPEYTLSKLIALTRLYMQIADKFNYYFIHKELKGIYDILVIEYPRYDSNYQPTATKVQIHEHEDKRFKKIVS